MIKKVIFIMSSFFCLLFVNTFFLNPWNMQHAQPIKLDQKCKLSLSQQSPKCLHVELKKN